MIKAIYAQYSQTYSQTFYYPDAAKLFLNELEDCGEAYAIGYHDEQTNVFYVEENMSTIADKTREDILAQKMKDLAAMEIHPEKIEFYEV
jgi:hypothetical protein